jgi:hypothetical protein
LTSDKQNQGGRNEGRLADWSIVISAIVICYRLFYKQLERREREADRLFRERQRHWHPKEREQQRLLVWNDKEKRWDQRLRPAGRWPVR